MKLRHMDSQSNENSVNFFFFFFFSEMWKYKRFGKRVFVELTTGQEKAILRPSWKFKVLKLNWWYLQQRPWVAGDEDFRTIENKWPPSFTRDRRTNNERVGHKSRRVAPELTTDSQVHAEANNEGFSSIDERFQCVVFEKMKLVSHGIVKLDTTYSGRYGI